MLPPVPLYQSNIQFARPFSLSFSRSAVRSAEFPFRFRSVGFPNPAALNIRISKSATANHHQRLSDYKSSYSKRADSEIHTNGCLLLRKFDNSTFVRIILYSNRCVMTTTTRVFFHTVFHLNRSCIYFFKIYSKPRYCGG